MTTQQRSAERDILDSPEAAHVVVRGGIWRSGSYLGTNLLAVVAAAVVVRYLGVHGLARYATVVSLTTLVSGVFEAGLGNLGVREAAVLHGAERDLMLRNLLGLRFLVAVAGLLVAMAIGLVLGYPPVMVVGVGVAGMGILVYTIQTHYATALQVQLRLAQYSALDLVRQAILTAILLTFVVLNFEMVALLAAPIPTNLVILGVTLWLVRGSMPLSASFAIRRWRGLVGKSFAVAAATATGVIYSQIAIVLMSVVSSQTQTGLFSASFRIFAVLAAIPGTLVASVLPILSRAAHDNHERLQGGLQRTCDVSAVLGAGLAALTIVGAPVAIAVVAGSEFDGAIGVLRLHGMALLPTSLIAFAGYGLMSLAAFRTILVGNIAGLIVTATLTVVLGTADGASGAAIGNLAGESTLALIYVTALMRRGFRMQWRAALVATMAALATIAISLAIPLPSVVQLVVAGLVFGALAFALGLVPSELLSALPSLRAPFRRARASSQ